MWFILLLFDCILCGVVPILYFALGQQYGCHASALYGPGAFSARRPFLLSSRLSSNLWMRTCFSRERGNSQAKMIVPHNIRAPNGETSILIICNAESLCVD